ncbi:hypothetical protein BpHYR1_012258 [Brachionus plicatilis]|uniref:Uncharacterized protein n=1 Tax=Brachionus plicatilis TaxID=10195 RepID=A0A3M7S948_BRAPC|nr:hypothetical protein BpHYR1_012258 [Brachionus plicatilis]
MSLTPALNVCCLDASFSLRDFSFDFWTRNSHCSVMRAKRLSTSFSRPWHLSFPIRSVRKTTAGDLWSETRSSFAMKKYKPKKIVLFFINLTIQKFIKKKQRFIP